MAEFDDGNGEMGEVEGGDLACVGAGVFVETVLGAKVDGGVVERSVEAGERERKVGIMKR